MSIWGDYFSSLEPPEPDPPFPIEPRISPFGSYFDNLGRLQEERKERLAELQATETEEPPSLLGVAGQALQQTGEDIAKATGRGFSNIAGGLMAAGQATGENLARLPVPESWKRRYLENAETLGRQAELQEQSRETGYLAYDEDRPESTARDIGLGAFELAPQLATVAATGGTAGTAILGTTAFGNEYRNAKEQGASDNEALVSAAATGASEAVLERFLGDVPLIRAIRGEGGRAVKSTKDALKSLLRSGNMEGMEEAAQHLTGRLAQEATYSDEGLSAEDLAQAGKQYGAGFGMAMVPGLAGSRAQMQRAAQEAPTPPPAPAPTSTEFGTTEIESAQDFAADRMREAAAPEAIRERAMGELDAARPQILEESLRIQEEARRLASDMEAQVPQEMIPLVRQIRRDRALDQAPLSVRRRFASAAPEVGMETRDIAYDLAKRRVLENLERTRAIPDEDILSGIEVLEGRPDAQQPQEAPEGAIPPPSAPETVQEAPVGAQGQDQGTPETPRSRLDISPPEEATGIVGQEMLPTISSPLEATPRERATQFVRRWLTSRKGLSEDVFQAVESKGAKMAAAKIASLDKANALRRATAGYLKQNPDVDPDAFTDAINARLEGRDSEIPLPKVVDQLAGKMREDVDSLTRTMIDEGMVSESMAETFQENLGQYLTRTYRAFDDPKHVQRLKKSGDWDRLKRELREIPEFAQLDEARLEGEMERIATRNAEDFFSGVGIGTIETGIYKRRKSIPRQIRELMGEEFDPATRYFKSVERMSRNVETFRLFDALRELGAREGWLFDKPVRGYAREIPGKGTTRDPLGGKFTNEEMADLITGATEQAHSGFMGQLARRAVGWSREALTVHNPQTQARNVEANFLLMMAGGNLGARFKPWGRGDKTLGVAKAAKEFKERGTSSGKKVLKLAEEVGLDDLTPAELAGMYGRAAQLGLTGTNVDLGIVKDLLESSDRLHGDKRGRNPLAAARRFNRKLYEAGDVVFKLAAWRSETAKQRWAHPELTAGEQEARAAKIVQDTMPNYSRLLGIFDKYRTNPVLGNFISFYSEIPRNVVNQTRTGLQELREGAQTGNKRQMIVGADRLTGTVAALSTPALIKAAAAALRSEDAPDDEEEDAIRPLLPPWMRYGQHIVMNVKDGKATVVDLSFMDPLTQLKEPVIAAIKTGGVDPTIMDRVSAAAQTFLEPYVQVGLAPKAAIEAWQGRTMEGRELYPETAPIGVKAKRTAAHLGKTFLPGVVRSGERLGKSATGHIEPWGRTYEMGHELLALVGPRVYTIDVGESLGYEARDYAAAFRAGRAEVNRVKSWQEAMGRAGKMVPAGKREEAERVAEASYREGLEGLVEVVNAARTLGLSDGRVARILDDAGLSKDDARRAVLSARAVDQGMPWEDVYERFVSAKYGAER